MAEDTKNRRKRGKKGKKTGEVNFRRSCVSDEPALVSIEEGTESLQPDEFASLRSVSQLQDTVSFVSAVDAESSAFQSTISAITEADKIPGVIQVTEIVDASSSSDPVSATLNPLPIIHSEPSRSRLALDSRSPVAASGLLTDPSQTFRTSSTRRPEVSPARRHWQEAGRRVAVARRVVNAFKPQETKYFSCARIVARILADNCLYWPIRDVTCQLSVVPFTSFFTMINWKRSLCILPLHAVEDVLENYFDERDEIEGRHPSPWKKAKYEMASALLAFAVCRLRTKIFLGQSMMESPVSLLSGIFSRILMITPFLGGYGALVPFPIQSVWIATMFMPLNVISTLSVYKDTNEVAAAWELYNINGIQGFYKGTFAGAHAVCSSVIAHLLTDFNVSNTQLAAGLALSCAVWAKARNRHLTDVGLLTATSFATAFLKKAVCTYFGEAPKRPSMTEVQVTKDYIEHRTLASDMTNRLSRRAKEEQFYAEVELEEVEDDDPFGIARSMSVSTIAHTVSGFLRQASKSTKHIAAAYLSGLHGDLYLLNGRYDAELDRNGRPLVENGRPKYCRMIHVEVSDDNDELPTDDFAYIHYVTTGSTERWVLVDQDKTTVLACCNDSAVYPFQVKAPWFVCHESDADEPFTEDRSVKVSREPTPFLHRMNVFSLLNQMLDEEDDYELDIYEERAVCPSECFVLRVQRQCLAKNSLQVVLGCLPSDLVAHEFMVEFKGEYGLDYGGLTREWFSQLANELTQMQNLEMQLWDMKINYEGPLFTVMPDETLLPCENAPVQVYLAIGRLLAMALIHGSFFPLPLSFVIFKYILGAPVTDIDLKNLDSDFYKHRLATLLKDKGVDSIATMLGEPLMFVSAASPRSHGERPLLEGGDEKEVTEDNKLEYAKLLTEEFLCGTIRQQLQALVTGFWDLCPRKALCAMTAKDLKVLTVGDGEPFNEEIFRINAKCESLEKNPPQFEWFLQAVAALSAEENVRFLQFFTGAPRMPSDGLRPAFTLVINGAWNTEQLPTAHTCANTVCIPAYASYELLDKKLRTALEFNVGFGFE